MSDHDLIQDIQDEREAWARFERRDGFANGFICGVLATAISLLFVVLLPYMLGWLA